MASIFKGLKETKPSGQKRDVTARPGRYLIRVDSMRQQESAKPPKGREFVAFEGTVVKVIDDAQGQSHQVGHEFVELCMNFGPSAQMFLAKIAGILKGVLNQDPDDDDGSTAVGADQPLKGLCVEMSAVLTPYADRVTKEQKVACNRRFHRSLSKSEATAELDEATIKRFWPSGGLIENPFAPDEAAAEG